MPQDMPPTGGYEPVQYRRNLPARGFKPRYYLLGMGVIMTYGFYKLAKGTHEHKEKMWSRIYLIPLLQAEADRDLVRRSLAEKAREKELLGRESKVYFNDKFVKPTYAVVPGEITKE